MKLAPLLLLAAACDQKVVVDTGGGDDTGTVDGRVVTITADGATADVVLGSVSTVALDGDDVVSVADLLDASQLGTTWAERTYTFVASDGFTPADVGCDPVDYTTLQGAYLYPASGNLVWESALNMRGCYFVNDITTIQVLDAE